MSSSLDGREPSQIHFGSALKPEGKSSTNVLPSLKELADLHTGSFPRSNPLLNTSPNTPPVSDSRSPTLPCDSPPSLWSRDSSPKSSATGSSNYAVGSAVRLPSLHEFDLAVEDIARAYGPPRTPPSPMPGLTPRRLLPRPPVPAFPAYTTQECFPGYGPSDGGAHTHMGFDAYPSPPPEGENRHINQKYTTEEGDFIIYAWHDRKLKWQRIKQDFAAMFGRTPERTVQGLQAWYYRMNQRIPLWDEDGWLCFENEDDLEPKHISIKCRDRDGQGKPSEPLGLAQRYPERAIRYSWVDPELKRKAQDWATKREMQYLDRRERRKRKDQRRLKL
ncbi:hypothetical protein B0I35DRAFT_404421 [Stachybotrys elegans]|uniref:Uncharacterized protein n=1 Tax=Stachybotrys elegans TaxID=80388 RepID=A0A8K0T4G3_9HYPO|nr:hypothetical protein B0I35DRAFT_404421 [Stachybotrys elegans]